MNRKAKSEFLKTISINGFSIEERNSQFILRPRGAEATAEIAIEENKENMWKVASASGAYSVFARGKKRTYFENYINQWAAQAALQTL